MSNKVEYLIQDMKKLPNKIPLSKVDKICDELKTEETIKYLQSLKKGSKPESALRESFFAGEPLLKDMFGELIPEAVVTRGFIDYKIEDKIGRVILLELKSYYTVDRDKLKEEELSWKDHKHQIFKYMSEKYRYVILTNLKEWYFFSNKQCVTEEKTTPFVSIQLDKFYEELRKETTLWDYLQFKELRTEKSQLDKQFLNSLKIWVNQLSDLKFKVSDEDKTNVIIHLINKFIFIQTLEDFRAIGKINWLYRRWKDKDEDWKPQGKNVAVEEFFNEIDKFFYRYYDTELFKTNILEKIDSSKTNMDKLYEKLKFVLGLNDYQQTFLGENSGIMQYDFVSIDEDILGKAYEKFLGDIRKEEAIYYTPKYITGYISENTVGRQYNQLLEDIKKKLEDLDFEKCEELIEKFVTIKVLDPACGSGSFLIKALRIIWKKYEEVRYLLNNTEKQLKEKSLQVTNTEEFSHGEVDKRIQNFRRVVGLDLHKRDLISKIVLRHIHGNDKDRNALEVAKINIWLEAIKLAPEQFRYENLPNVKHILPDLEMNLGNGDSLVSLLEDQTIEFLKENHQDELKILFELRKRYLKDPKIEEVVDEINTIKNNLRKELDEEFKKYLEENNLPLEIFEKTKPFYWALDFWYIFFEEDLEVKPKEKRGFDVVIGNPPYVKAKLMDKTTRKFLDKIFLSSTGTYDIYVNFIEKSCNLLKERGMFSFINPSKFIFTDYGAGIRRYINDNLTVDQFIDFRDAQVFEAATNYTCLLFLTKLKQEKYDFRFATVKIKNIDIPSFIKELRTYIFTENEIEGAIYAIRTGSSENLKMSSWGLISKRQYNLISKLEKNNMLLEDYVYKIFVGLQITPIEVFAVRIIKNIGKNVYISPIKPEKENEIYEVEKDLLKPVLKSSDIERYYTSPKNYYVIFPYKFGKKKEQEFDWSFINETEMEKYYPKTLAYLKIKKHFLDEREEGRWKDSAKWYEYSRQQNFGCHQLKKIITPGISTNANYSLDEEGYYIDRGSYGILIKEGEEIEPKFLTALLNSKVLDFYLKMTAPLISGGYFSYQTKYLRKLPILRGDKFKKPIIQLVQKIITLKKLQHNFREIWEEYSQKYRNNYRSFEEILNHDKINIQYGKFDDTWTTEVSIYPDDDNELLDEEFGKFRIIGGNDNKLKIYGISDSKEYVLLEITTREKELRNILYLEISELLDSQRKIKTLRDIFSKSEISIITPEIWKNSVNLIEGVRKKFEEWLNEQNYDIEETDIIKIDNKIQEVDDLIDAHLFKLYELNKGEVETVLDSLNTLESIKRDILEKCENL